MVFAASLLLGRKLYLLYIGNYGRSTRMANSALIISKNGVKLPIPLVMIGTVRIE